MALHLKIILYIPNPWHHNIKLWHILKMRKMT